MTLAVQVPTTATAGGHLRPQLVNPLGRESLAPPDLAMQCWG